eukprot:TRINITY_DN44342_c0_g1_i1.p1 TRINITY_DN44342_c0_g1~~TRINITY_DN44342_c0_g1_i1.p1  ORF type:complete len:318 (+),score=33.95 TRINITY_DN44342_c0_g1_i1:116-1069(+)
MSQPSASFQGLVTQEALADQTPTRQSAIEARSASKSSPSYGRWLLCCLYLGKQGTGSEEVEQNVVHVQNEDEHIGPPQSDSDSMVARDEEVEQHDVQVLVAPKSTPPNPGNMEDKQQHVQEYLLPMQGSALAGRKTLVLDLDETLVHSSFSPVPCEMILTLTLGTEQHKVFVKKRPGVDDFLRIVSKYYEVVVFTASTALYANTLLDELDTCQTIHHRLFRNACTRYREGYVKDLSRLGRNLEGVIIIDNLPICYALQPENAIPIKTWRDDPEDTELYDLVPILVSLARVEHIPQVLQSILNDDVEHFDMEDDNVER